VVRSLVRRLATALVTLFLVSVVVFLLAHLTPGDAVEEEGEALANRGMTEEHRAELRRIYHLDEPLHRQYLLWLKDASRGRLGISFHDRRPVSEKIGERIGTTLTINGLSLLVMISLSVPIGAAAALRPGSAVDRWVGGATYALYAVPVFWAGPLLQMIFSVHLGWLPLYGLTSDGAESLETLARLGDTAAHLVLPVLCLAYGGLAYLSRFVRTTLLESSLVDAARAARARGLSAFAVS
jgi:peptide/nickel transport system permease protein